MAKKNNNNSGQTGYFYSLLHTLGLTDEKGNIVSEFTNGRTESVREMTTKELQDAIDALKMQLPNEAKEDGLNKMRRKIIAICCSDALNLTKNDKPDMERIKKFVKDKSGIDKPFNNYESSELVSIINQLQIIQKKIYEQRTKSMRISKPKN